MVCPHLLPKKRCEEKLLAWCIRWPHMPDKQEIIAAHCTCGCEWPDASDGQCSYGPSSDLKLEKSNCLQSSWDPSTITQLSDWTTAPLGEAWRVVSSPWNVVKLLFVSKANYLKWLWAPTCRQVGFQQFISKSVVLNLKVLFLAKIIKERHRRQAHRNLFKFIPQ